MDEKLVLGRFSPDFKLLILNSSHVIPRYLRPLLDVELEIILQKRSKKRSDAQNRYFHGVVCTCIIAFEKKNGADWLQNLTSKQATSKIKAYIYQNILMYKFKLELIDGKEYYTQEDKRMSEMTTKEFTNAVEEIRNYYAAKDCHIPDPIQHGYLVDYIKAQQR